MGDVVYAPIVTSLDMDSKRVLEGALRSELSEVVVLGWSAIDGWYFASNMAAGSKVTWYLTRGLHKLHKIEDEIENGEIGDKRLTVPDGPKGQVMTGPWQGDCEEGGGI